MNKQEVLNLATWRSENELRLLCYVPVFEKDIEIHLFSEKDNYISDRSVQTINDLIALSLAQFKRIKELLWDDCKLNCEVSSYGFDVPDNKSESEVNHENFSVFNPEDAYKKSTLIYLNISEDDQNNYQSNFGHLTFDNEWNSHLTVVIMKNGNIVGYGDSGLYLGEFE